MSNARILVVEDDFDISNVLRIYFTGQGYDVEVAARGSDALKACRRELPNLIVLDIMLPDMDGYAVCRELRVMTRTSHIPIIFLTQRDERSDRIAGLELGADDYITKPFDIEELNLRVRTAIRSYQRLNMTDPRTGLPSGRLIEEQFHKLMRSSGWTYIVVKIDQLSPFADEYGFVAANEALRSMALLLNEAVGQFGTANDFLGHASDETFVVITHSKSVAAMIDHLRKRFDEEAPTHYSFVHREQSGIPQPDGTLAPLMRLAVGTVSGQTQSFADIREITENVDLS
ncbi:MAG: response regulator [Chloroflexi bacterium]|nr:response regulator [Chloroflexota bacterium]MCI0577322.1 response regulator [Chloroflexota bacterium]MCI0646823.1 response regulator [Chloroflexota bacterium]MCI0728125.1 response regulator [Chloroflexota bacterium]